MAEILTGGCHCGEVRYEATVENNEAYYCHCKMCRRSFGNIFATFFNLPKASVKWARHPPKYFHSSKIAQRGFCAECGTPLLFEFHDSEFMDLSVGSLDHPEQMEPVSHFAVEYRLASFYTPDGLPEETIDSNEKINARWQQAYRDNTPAGPRRAYKNIK
ncbi:MAG: GFA family protein [Burkholderiales bacterium]